MQLIKAFPSIAINNNLLVGPNRSANLYVVEIELYRDCWTSNTTFTDFVPWGIPNDQQG